MRAALPNVLKSIVLDNWGGRMMPYEISKNIFERSMPFSWGKKFK